MLLSAKQKSVTALADRFDRGEVTIRTDLTRDNTEGRQGLIPQSRDGAPAKVPFRKAAWEELRPQRPSQCEQ